MQALRAFLDQLGPRDRAWATFFNGSHEDFAEKPLPAVELVADPALSRLAALGADGGTELLPALQHVLGKIALHSVGHPAVLVLITDGGVANEAAILAALRGHAELRVHTFGIDTAVNDALLARLASEHRGSCALLTPSDDIAGAVARLGERLRRPVLTGLQLDGGWESSGAALPDLCSGEAVSLSLKGPADAEEVVLTGRLPDGASREFRVPLAARREPALRLLWAKGRIDRLLTSGDHTAALGLAKEHNLLCDGAAFIAWDEAEKVAIAEREVYQPAMSQMLLCRLTPPRIPVSYNLKSSDCIDSLATDQVDPLEQSPAALLHSFFSERRPPRVSARGAQRAAQSAPPWLGDYFRGGSSLPSALADRALIALCVWHSALTNTIPAVHAAELQDLVLLLATWLTESESAFEQRQDALFDLLEQLEVSARAPVSWLCVTRDWAKDVLRYAPTHAQRVLAALDRFEKSTASAGQPQI